MPFAISDSKGTKESPDEEYECAPVGPEIPAEHYLAHFLKKKKYQICRDSNMHTKQHSRTQDKDQHPCTELVYFCGIIALANVSVAEEKHMPLATAKQLA